MINFIKKFDDKDENLGFLYLKEEFFNLFKL